MKKPTMAHTFLAMRERSATITAIRTKRSSGWVDIGWGEYFRETEMAAAGLLSLGVKSGDRVALIANTRYEWGCSDFAIMAVQAATVPIYPNSTPEDTEYMLNDSQALVLIAEGRSTLKLWRKIKEKCPHVRHVICFETDDPNDPSLMTWDALKEMGRDFLNSKPASVVDLAAATKPEQMATLLYTSGTTGRPKGVVICHEQAISEVSEAFPFAGVTTEDISLAFLPFAHVLGRVELWGHCWSGFVMAYAESIEKVRNNLAEIRPTILVSVPRIFEKIHTAITAQMEGQPLKRKMFDWAVKVGTEVSELKLTRRLIPVSLLAQYEVARRLVLGKISEAFGGRVRFAISGGAPIQRDVALFFHAAGVLILEGYGLTETTAAVTVNTPYNYKFGSVGRPIGDVELKIADDGEILVRSKKVMREYYKNPEATKDVFTDGWFHTGDIGEILPGGDLKITDRKKDLIKTAGGKYVAPQRLEGLLKLHPCIGFVHIHGDQRKYIVALISPDRLYLEKIAKEQNWQFTQWAELLARPEVEQLMRKAVSETNALLGSWESIKRYHVLPIEFSVEGGELTPSLKVKRRLLDQRYKELIESLYD